MRKYLALTLVFALMAGLVCGALPTEAAPGNRQVDVFVGFKETPGAAEHALIRRFGGEILNSYWLVPAVAARIPEASVPGLMRNPHITVIEPILEIFPVGGAVSEEALARELDNSWGVKRIGSGSVHPQNRGSGVKVAVIDSGIQYNHPELAGFYGGGYDFADGNDDPMDKNGHGTHVAGIIGAVRDGAGVVGVAPEATLYALKVFHDSGSGNYNYVISALQWAIQNGMQVTNNSYGSRGHPGSLVEQAFNNAYAAGILHVAAAGNEGNPGGGNDSVIYPARFASVMAVAATNKNDVRPSFSSTGPDLEISAPGVDINSTWIGTGNNSYRVLSGTSMASPHVAGTAALVIASGLTGADAVRQRLKDTADDLGSANRYGSGLVNAGKAVLPTSGSPDPDPDPPDPAINVSVTSILNAGGAKIAVTVTDENNAFITGLDSSAFAAIVNDEAVEMTFVETTAGIYEGELTDLPEGTYTVKVTVTCGDLSGYGSTTFTIEPDPAPGGEKTAVVSYTTSGGKNNDRHLQVTVTLFDTQGTPVSGASLAVAVYRNGALYEHRTGTTNGNGSVTFSFNNAPSGRYTTVVQSVNGEIWTGTTIDGQDNNGFGK